MNEDGESRIKNRAKIGNCRDISKICHAMNLLGPESYLNAVEFPLHIFQNFKILRFCISFDFLKLRGLDHF